jgi:formate hydrogenlyase transcriptional activator
LPYQSLEEQLRFEKLLFDLSARLMASPVDQVDSEIDHALGQVMEFFQVDRSALLEVQGDKAFSRVTHLMTREGIERVSGEINLWDLFPWSYGTMLLQGKHLDINGLEYFPKGAQKDRQSFAAMGIKSTLTIPLSSGGRITRVILIQTLHRNQIWPEEYIPRLRLLGEIFVNALERKEDRSRLEARLRFETLLAEISAHFINLPADQIGRGIEKAQRRICEFFNLDRSTLWQICEDEPGARLLLTHGHFLTAVAARPERMYANDFFPWTVRRILAGEAVIISKLGDLPPDAVRDLESFRVFGTKSTVVVPLSVGEDRVFGLLAFGTSREERRWSETSIMGITLVAQVFANTLSRERTDKVLREQEERFRVTFEQAAVGIAHVAPDGRFLRINRKFCEIVGYSREEMLGRTFQDITYPDDLAADVAQVGDLLSGKIDAYSMEKRYIRKDGGPVWVDLTVALVRNEAGRPLWFVSVVEDISARKRMEKQLTDNFEEIKELKQRLERENIYLQEEIRHLVEDTDIVGQSAVIKEVLSQAERVAPTDSTVLLLGETGTGKELLARAIHSLSSRKSRPLVTVNCASLPPTLIESELFGREKGAYTGALTRMTGRFELADGATLFLDEIGELPLELQSKILRFLEEGSFERLGSSKPVQVDVRIIAATNRDIEREVEEGKFRRDLFYRLNVFPIRLPPLRERPEDIPLLVRAVVKEFQKKMGKEVESIPKRTMQALQSYHWPGNVRELRNLVEHAMILSRGKSLDIPVPTRAFSETSAAGNLQDMERAHVTAVLEKTEWRISGPGGAAEVLGLKRTTLQAKMKKLGIKQARKPLPK